MLCQPTLVLSNRLSTLVAAVIVDLAIYSGSGPANTAPMMQSSLGIGNHYQLTSALAASSLSAFSFSAFSFSRFSFSKCSFSAFSLAAASAAACSVEVPANRHEDAIETTHWHAACEQHAYPAAWASGLAQETAGRR